MKYIGFCASKDTRFMLPEFINALDFIVDNNCNRVGEKICNTKIVSVESLKKEKDVFIFILSDYYLSEIELQLNSLGYVKNKDYMPVWDWFGNEIIPAPYKTSSWNEYQKTWDYNGERWECRKRLMVSMLNFNEIHSIADMGCGTMGLKEMIPTDVSYYPVDYIKRGEDTILCDFNQYQFPNFEKIGTVDCIFLSGVLRYIEDWRWLLDQSIKCSRYVILTYVTGGLNLNVLQEKGRLAGYRHSVPIMDIVCHFQNHGWHIDKHNIYRRTTQIICFKK